MFQSNYGTEEIKKKEKWRERVSSELRKLWKDHLVKKKYFSLEFKLSRRDWGLVPVRERPGALAEGSEGLHVFELERGRAPKGLVLPGPVTYESDLPRDL